MSVSFRIVGALLVVGGFTYIGLLSSYSLKSTILLLEEYICILDNLICEMEFQRTPLPVLCRSVVRNRCSRLHDVFNHLADEMDAQTSPNVSTCVRTVLDRSGELPAAVREMLCRLGESLGRFDVEGEISNLQSLRSEAIDRLNTMRLTQKEKGKTNQTLWVCAGALAAVLMM